jgi:UDP-4-amino-4-deoxy-L-arabinose formyltransferase/UDP-glucuronic acid dehydrogenase (UDP-4-keto-hexauronic acid decarboxylating)
MNIVLVAEESAGIQLLRALAQTQDRLIAVMTSAGRKNTVANVAAAAGSLGVDVWPAQRVRDPQLADELRAARVDLLLNAHSLFVVHDAVLAAPSIGAFNLHPGPLPRYAGLNCPSWAICRGEREYGVTVHRMAPRIDAGTIAYQATFPIDEDETGLTLGTKCIRAGVPLMLQLAQTARQDPSAIPALPQDLSRRQYFGRDIPRGGLLDWSEPAHKVLAFVRAFDFYPFPSPWGHPHTACDGLAVSVVKAAPTGISTSAPPGTLRHGAGDHLEVATADEWVALELLRVAGRYVKPGEVLASGTQLQPPQDCSATATAVKPGLGA